MKWFHCHIISLVFIVMVISLILSSSIAYGSHSEGISIQYVVTINNPSDRQATVKMIVTNLSTDILKIMEYSSISGYGINVTALIVKDKNGNNIDYRYIPGNEALWEPDLWDINCSGLNECYIEYTIETTKTAGLFFENDPYYCYLTNDFGVFLGEYLFLFPHYENTIRSITVEFNLPQGWQIITPWPQENGIYNPISILELDTYFQLGSSVIGLGNFDLFTKVIGNTEIIVAVYNGWESSTKETLAQRVWDIYAYQTSIYRNSLNYPYVAIFCPYADDGKWIYGGTGATGQIFSSKIGTFSPNWVNYAHEVCETRWINYNWGYVDNSCGWFKAGASHTIALNTVLNTSIYEASQAESHLIGMHDYYVQNFITPNKDMPLVSVDSYSPFNHSLKHYKGTLVAILLAKDIYSKTNGQITCHTLNRTLFEKYWGTGSYVEEEDLMEELTKLTEVDFTQFFNDYIYGTKEITIGDLSSSFEILGLRP